MKDGTTTSGLLALPADHHGRVIDGKRPTILVRTPYGSHAGKRSGALFVERGFNLLYQDTRGRFDSGGEFFPVQVQAVPRNGTQVDSPPLSAVLVSTGRAS
jgi:uncharacterized protein